MFTEVLAKIEQIKSYLEEDPNRLVWGAIKTETAPRLFNANNPLKDYYELLNKYSYLSCGSIRIFGYAEVETNQYYVSEIPEDPASWRCIGRSHTHPIYLNIHDGIVKILEGEPWTGQNFKSYGRFEDFINLYVVGEQYRELWGEDDWYRLLVKLGLA